jgi:hypothetical protein
MRIARAKLVARIPPRMEINEQLVKRVAKLEE